jgi:hypothetical protein
VSAAGVQWLRVPADPAVAVVLGIDTLEPGVYVHALEIAAVLRQVAGAANAAELAGHFADALEQLATAPAPMPEGPDGRG